MKEKGDFMHISKLVFTLLVLGGSLTLAQTAPNESVFVKKQKFDTDGTELYSSNLDLKRHKKFGFGTSVGGVAGMFGLNAEINLEPENALVLGLGTGPNYGTFNVLWKNNVEANYFSPYFKVGYSKWFSAGGGSGSASESAVLRQIFSERDLKNGKFGADFLVGALGAEYNQLEGELSGVNFYGELVLMTEIKTAKIVPTGAVGITYFY